MRWAIFGFLTALAAGLASSAALAAEATPTGQAITPTAAPGAIFQRLVPDLPDFPGHAAGQASALALSPDGRTLLILTSGYNLMFGDDGKPIPAESTEYVFVYDVGGPAPVKRQVIQIPNSFLGLAWAPDGARFYVSGGVDDDVLEYAAGAAGYAPARTFPLGHAAGLGLKVRPEAGELALSPDGSRLLVANVQNDSVSLIDLASGRIRETDLRPGGGRPGGSFPRAVVWTADDKAYVTSERDREIIALAVADDGAVTVERRIRTRGQPVALAANPVRGRLYAAADDSDGVSVVDTASDRIVEQVATLAPADVAPARANHLGGAGSNGLALSADGRTLLVSNGAENDIAVVRLDDVAAGARAAPAGDGDGDGDDDSPRAPGRSAVIGLIPTGWYPTAVALSRDGRRIFAVNGKSNTGPVPHNCRANAGIDPHHDDACKATNEYVWQKEVAGFLALPAPAPATLGALTRQVARNNRYLAEDEGDAATFAFLRRHIRHVIYIVKENRTYDQVLGDLEVGNGDPRLTVFPRAMTPNQHALARQFVDLDAFFDSGESSNTGWNWTTAARTNDFTEREAPVNYGDRGLQYDQEGDNRQINVGYATSAERVAANPASPADPDILPGARDVAAPDGPDADEGRGYIWDAALRAGLSVRNYGFYGDLSRYADRTPADQRIPRERDPHAKGLTVFYTSKAALMPVTDPYFRGFDQAFPDYWRFQEWKREFDGYVARGDLPALSLVRLCHDHTGGFAEAIDGVNTVEAELADNDYAVGLLIQSIARSRYAKDTLIFVVEDDAQDGPDHVDAHRSLAFVAGPYVRQGAVVSHRYTTVNLVKTIEAVLDLAPMNLNDSLAEPMGAVFDRRQADWRFEARVPAVLRSTALPLPPAAASERGCPTAPTRDAAWWASAMRGQDFSVEDHLDTPAFNHALWAGLKGEGAPYPATRSGRDLRTNRPALLRAAKVSPCRG